jgi:hypothetical protein
VISGAKQLWLAQNEGRSMRSDGSHSYGCGKRGNIVMATTIVIRSSK